MQFGRQIKTPGTDRPPFLTNMTSFLQRRWWIMVLAVLGIGLMIWLGYGYLSTRAELQKLSQAKDSSQQEIIASISQRMELPPEEPVMATINDISKLAGQEFFRNAQDGDKVFIFSQANKALIYRPSTQKVIEYSKVNLNDMQNQP